MKNKKYELHIRLSEVMIRKLLSICAVKGMSKTAAIEELIASEYSKNRKYENRYFADLEKEI